MPLHFLNGSIVHTVIYVVCTAGTLFKMLACMFKWTETLFAKCLFAVLCVVWCVYTLYIVMSERSAAARICGCSLSRRRRMTDKRRSVPYADARLTRSSLFRVLNSRINTIVAGAKQITAISHWLSSLCVTIWCFLLCSNLNPNRWLGWITDSLNHS